MAYERTLDIGLKRVCFIFYVEEKIRDYAVKMKIGSVRVVFSNINFSSAYGMFWRQTLRIRGLTIVLAARV